MSSRKDLFSVELINVKGAYNTYLLGGSAIDYLYIIEDIYTFGISGKIRFNDSVGIKEFGPLTGEERIKITFGNGDQTPNNPQYRVIEMLIFSIDKLESQSSTQLYTGDTIELTLVDEYYFKMHCNFIEKSWNDAYIHNIVGEIASKYVGIQSTDYESYSLSREKLSHFDTNYRTPAECINWLMSRCSDTVYKSPAFLFYRAGSRQDNSFKFNFTPMERLMNQSDKELMGPEGENFIYTFNTFNQDYVNYINEYALKPIDKNALRSLLGGSILGYDIKRKKLIRRDFTYQDGLSRTTILGRYSIFPKDILNNVSAPIVMEDGYGSEAVLDNIWFSNWIKSYNAQNLVSVTVKGHEKRYAGGMIKIDWPSLDNKEKNNKQLNGKFLVKSITHYFSGNENEPFQQRMILIKNGYRDCNNLEMIEGVKTNG